MDGVAAHPPEPDAAGEAVRHAQAELERAVREGNLTRDPMRFPLGALAVTLGAQHQLHLANVEHTRTAAGGMEQRLVAAIRETAPQPFDPAAIRRLEKAAASGADRRAAETARAHNLRTVLLAATVLAGSILSTGALCYWWGHASALASVQETESGLADAFRTSPEAAADWLNLMRRNDLPSALATCTGERAFTDQTGSPSCYLPMRLGQPKPEIPARLGQLGRRLKGA